MQRLVRSAITLGMIGWANTCIAAESTDEFVTAENAILCTTPGNLDIANEPTVAENQVVLRGMGCLRIEAGVRTRLLGSLVDPWRVRLYPTGMSEGVVLWGLSSSFTKPDGSKLAPVKRASS